MKDIVMLLIEPSDEELRLRNLEAQARWEVEGVRRGVERYRAMTEGTTAAGLSAAQSVMKAILPRLVALIETAQRDCLDAPTRGGPPPLYAVAIHELDAATQAVIALSVVFDAAVMVDVQAAPDGSADRVVYASDKASVMNVTRSIARALHTQIEFTRWERKAKGDKDNGGPELVKKFHTAHPDMDRRTWRKWAAKIEADRLAKWDDRLEAAYGAVLLNAVCEASNGGFVVEAVGMSGGRTENRLRPSVRLCEMLQDRLVRAEVARPFLMPMICPPNEWEYAA